MNNKEKQYRPLIIGISVALPLAVSILYFLPQVDGINENTRHFLNQLPLFNAIINGTTALILIAAFRAIRSGNIELHKKLMSTALIFSVLFLISYVSFHLTTESTKYAGEGFIKNVYYFVLLSHILLSVIIVPLVLITYVRALAKRFDRHKKIARITFPLWLYVAITGVLVYVMISPYYSFNL